MTQTKKKKKWIYTKMPKGYDKLIHLAVIILMVFGTIMIASASMGLKTGDNRYLIITVVKQIVYVTFGYALMLMAANRFKFDSIRGSNFPPYVIAVVGALIACRAFKPVNGSYGWIRIPFPGTQVTIQPSEFAKVVAILIVAAYCGDFKRSFKGFWEMMKVPILFLCLFLGIILVIQHDLGSAVVIFLVTCVCYLIPEHPQLKTFQTGLKIVFWCFVGFVIFLLATDTGLKIIQALPLENYQINRFLSAIDPTIDKYNSSYQLLKGLTSFASGGWFGRGFGNSVLKYSDFPETNTDYILAILVEEFGYVGFLLLMSVYCLILARLFYYILKLRSEKGRIILTGTAMYLLVHLFFNIGGVTGLIPLTGVPLLMISAGGSSTVAFMLAIGISQAVIRMYNRKEIA